MLETSVSVYLSYHVELLLLILRGQRQFRNAKPDSSYCQKYKGIKITQKQTDKGNYFHPPTHLYPLSQIHPWADDSNLTGVKKKKKFPQVQYSRCTSLKHLTFSLTEVYSRAVYERQTLFIITPTSLSEKYHLGDKLENELAGIKLKVEIYSKIKYLKAKRVYAGGMVKVDLVKLSSWNVSASLSPKPHPHCIWYREDIYLLQNVVIFCAGIWPQPN